MKGPSKTEQSLPGGVRLVPASMVSIEALAGAYNQARADYLVPMQTTAARLAEYARVYDVDLDHSRVAVEGDEILGLGMLGVRPGRTWITRLGVLPNHRRRGIGEALVSALLDETRSLGCPVSILEVIQGNRAAHGLFTRSGFRETRVLLVLRRPPGPALPASGRAAWMKEGQALDRLRSCPGRNPWTNEVESYRNGGDALGLEITLDGNARGWMVFRRQEPRLSHFFFHTERGDPREVGTALLGQVYSRSPQADTEAENIAVDDPHVGALVQAGFREAFRRVEMVWRNDKKD